MGSVSTDLEIIRFVVEIVGSALFGVLAWFARSLIADFRDKHQTLEKRHGNLESDISALKVMVADNRAATEKQLAENRSATEKQLADHKLHVAENYSTKNDLGKAIEQFTRSNDAIFARLGRIEDKIDQKADKVGHV